MSMEVLNKFSSWGVKDKPTIEDHHQTSQPIKITSQSLSTPTTQEDNKTLDRI
jgi:hypothetical protein